MMHEHEIERLVMAAHYRHDCPPSMMLSEYESSTLAPDETVQIAEHLAVCTHCQADMALLATFLSAVEHAAAPAQSSWHQAIGYQWQRIQETGKLMIRLVDEALTPPAMSSVPVLAAVKSGRSAQPPQAHHILREIALTNDATGSMDVSALAYADTPDATQCTVVVRVQIPNRWPQLAGVHVQCTAGQWSAEQATNDDGDVRFDNVPAGSLDNLTITIVSEQDLYSATQNLAKVQKGAI